MGDWSLIEGQRSATGGMVPATSFGTTVTANAAAHTKGNWAVIYASVPFDANGILVYLECQTGLATFLADIGIGAADNEIVLLSNLHISMVNSPGSSAPFYFPINIPTGARISARCQSNSGGAILRVMVTLFASGFMPTESLGRVTTYGAATADSGGTGVDPGAVAHTKNAYSQINGATASPIRALVIAIGNQRNTSATTCGWLVDVAIGAGGSELIILPDIAFVSNTTTDAILPPTIGPISIDIPAGTRLAARAQCSITDATDRLFDIIIHGID